jgi:hypothetical protein
MTNLKNEFTKTVAAKILPFKGWSILLALVLVLTTAGTALAYNSGAKGHAFTATFTKWVTTWPPTQDEPANMVGVVGGAVGRGSYQGEVISADPGDNITTIHALYHINGRKQAFTADLIIRQDESAGRAAITGFVTEGSEGWMKGASVTGKYKVLADCPIETPGNVFGTVCFKGVLHVRVPK